MRKRVLRIIIVVLLLSMCAIIIKQQYDLNLYKNGFDITGTYEYIDDNAELENKEHYIAFSQDDQGRLKFYSYKQFGKKIEGSYIETSVPNLFFLKGPEGGSESFFLLDKKFAYLISKDNTIKKYKKFSDELIFINTNQVEN